MVGLAGWITASTKTPVFLKSLTLLPGRILRWGDEPALPGWAHRNHTCPRWDAEGDLTTEDITPLATTMEERATSQGMKMLLEAEGKEIDSPLGPSDTDSLLEPNSPGNTLILDFLSTER